MKTYKMIFSDIDGTLLTNDHRVTERIRDKITALSEAGVPFVLVSARPPKGIWPIQRMIGIEAPIVAYGGGLILDYDKTVLHSQGMDMEAAIGISQYVQAHTPDICCNIYAGERWIVEDHANEWVRREIEVIGFEPERGNLEGVRAEGIEIHKLLLMGEPAQIAALNQELGERYPELTISRSAPFYLEVMDGAATKGSALRALCEKKGIGAQEAIAFGDSQNDMSMLQAAGLGVAMENAPQEVKNQADMVTLDNEHEGLLKVLCDIWP